MNSPWVSRDVHLSLRLCAPRVPRCRSHRIPASLARTTYNYQLLKCLLNQKKRPSCWVELNTLFQKSENHRRCKNEHGTCCTSPGNNTVTSFDTCTEYIPLKRPQPTRCKSWRLILSHCEGCPHSRVPESLSRIQREPACKSLILLHTTICLAWHGHFSKHIRTRTCHDKCRHRQLLA